MATYYKKQNAIVRRVLDGEQAAWLELRETCAKMIAKMASKSRSEHEREELTAIVEAALWEAVTKWEPERGDYMAIAKVTCQHYVSAYFAKMGGVVAVPRSKSVRAARKKLKAGQAPSTELERSVAGALAPWKADHESAHDADGPEEVAMRREQLAVVRAWLRLLSPKDQVCAKHLLLGDGQLADVAEVLGISKRVVSRNRQRLERELRAYVERNAPGLAHSVRKPASPSITAPLREEESMPAKKTKVKNPVDPSVLADVLLDANFRVYGLGNFALERDQVAELLGSLGLDGSGAAALYERWSAGLVPAADVDTEPTAANEDEPLELPVAPMPSKPRKKADVAALQRCRERIPVVSWFFYAAGAREAGVRYAPREGAPLPAVTAAHCVADVGPSLPPLVVYVGPDAEHDTDRAEAMLANSVRWRLSLVDEVVELRGSAENVDSLQSAMLELLQHSEVGPVSVYYNLVQGTVALTFANAERAELCFRRATEPCESGKLPFGLVGSAVQPSAVERSENSISGKLPDGRTRAIRL